MKIPAIKVHKSSKLNLGKNQGSNQEQMSANLALNLARFLLMPIRLIILTEQWMLHL